MSDVFCTSITLYTYLWLRQMRKRCRYPNRLKWIVKASQSHIKPIRIPLRWQVNEHTHTCAHTHTHTCTSHAHHSNKMDPGFMYTLLAVYLYAHICTHIKYTSHSVLMSSLADVLVGSISACSCTVLPAVFTAALA